MAKTEEASFPPFHQGGRQMHNPLQKMKATVFSILGGLCSWSISKAASFYHVKQELRGFGENQDQGSFPTLDPYWYVTWLLCLWTHRHWTACLCAAEPTLSI